MSTKQEGAILKSEGNDNAEEEGEQSGDDQSEDILQEAQEARGSQEMDVES